MSADLWLIFSFVCAVLCYLFWSSSGAFEERKKNSTAVVFGLIGLIFIVCFGFCFLNAYEDGSPLTQISPGIYKIGFVYQAGANVTVGIEKEGEAKEVRSTVNGVEKVEKYKIEHLFLYQFPMKDFEGDILPDAHKLVAYKIVTDEGMFNRYKLGYNIVQLQ